MKKIIINADDFGMMTEVNLGIIEGISQGVITSVSVLINMAAAEAADFLKNHREVGGGIHLNISQGRPLSPVSKVATLVDRDGQFYSWPIVIFRLFFHLIDLEEVEREWQLQLEKFKKLLKHEPYHLDAHHHLHLYPSLFPLILKIAKKRKIRAIRCHNSRFFSFNTFWPWSWRKMIVTALFALERKKLPQEKIIADHFLDMDWGGPFDSQGLAKMINNFPEGITNLSCHPAKLENPGAEKNSYLFQRHKELEALLSKKVKEALVRFQKINFSEIDSGSD